MGVVGEEKKLAAAKINVLKILTEIEIVHAIKDDIERGWKREKKLEREIDR